MDLSFLAERAEGDARAFEDLYRRLYPSTYNYIRYRVNDRQTCRRSHVTSFPATV